MTNCSTIAGKRAPRIQAASALLYCVMVISVLVLLEHLRPRPTRLYEEDSGTIQDVSGQPLYQGDPLDYWILAADGDRQADEALSALGPVAVPLLVERLKDVRMRVPAAVALMRMGSAARPAVPALIALLQHKDSDRQTVFLVVSILGCIGPDAAAALPALLAVVETDNGTCYRAAIHTLGGIGAKAREAVPLLHEALDSPNDLTRARAAEALWRIERRWESLLPILVEVSEYGNVLSADLAWSLLIEIQAERTRFVAARTDNTALPQALLLSSESSY